MKIHEYQGKELLRKYGVPVPRGIVARSPEEAYHAAKELGGSSSWLRRRSMPGAVVKVAASSWPAALTRRKGLPARCSA